MVTTMAIPMMIAMVVTIVIITMCTSGTCAQVLRDCEFMNLYKQPHLHIYVVSFIQTISS